MNLRVLNRAGFAALIFALIPCLLSSCKKETEATEVYDNVIYGIDTVRIYASGAEKVKQKSQTQYISIMYGDLFGSNISDAELSELSELSLSIGDKSMANELTLSNYLKSTSLDIPTNSEMRADVESFVELTYLRFYQRNPGPYEKLYLTELIEKDTELSVMEIYTAFILADEYYYY